MGRHRVINAIVLVDYENTLRKEVLRGDAIKSASPEGQSLHCTLKISP